MNERNIFAYFHELDEAERAAYELRNSGFKKVQVDRFSAAPGGGKDTDLDSEINGILRQQNESLTTTTLGIPNTNPDLRVIAATHPDASGMSDGDGFHHPADICLTVLTTNDQYPKAEAILKKYKTLF
ncbi:hypothetical protein SAMN05444392_10361 [Seinonella peptonophila]|uniref:Heat induced stress protein YflT n=1 Tax=Seinonella peptonophila TaxID=112248 RepID=A0A1M4W6H8_9BACL|nr:hypothetical protein [Seinonella peptonophila]SHE76826.1 hypothetical protein SAMN05444392_10361 [Seinonella peptonophila]